MIVRVGHQPRVVQPLGHAIAHFRDFPARRDGVDHQRLIPQAIGIGDLSGDLTRAHPPLRDHRIAHQLRRQRFKLLRRDWLAIDHQIHAASRERAQRRAIAPAGGDIGPRPRARRQRILERAITARIGEDEALAVLLDARLEALDKVVGQNCLRPVREGQLPGAGVGAAALSGEHRNPARSARLEFQRGKLLGEDREVIEEQRAVLLVAAIIDLDPDENRAVLDERNLLRRQPPRAQMPLLPADGRQRHIHLLPIGSHELQYD